MPTYARRSLTEFAWLICLNDLHWPSCVWFASRGSIDDLKQLDRLRSDARDAYRPPTSSNDHHQPLTDRLCIEGQCSNHSSLTQARGGFRRQAAASSSSPLKTSK